jgi:hypothetical protein
MVPPPGPQAVFGLCSNNTIKRLNNRFMAAVKAHRRFPALRPEKDRTVLQITSHFMRGAECEGIRPIKTFQCFY